MKSRLALRGGFFTFIQEITAFRKYLSMNIFPCIRQNNYSKSPKRAAYFKSNGSAARHCQRIQQQRNYRLVHISQNTIETHHKSLMSKLEAKNAVNLVLKTINLGVIPLDSQ